MSLIINGERISDRKLEQELLQLSAGLEMDAPHAGNIDPATLRSLALRNIVDRVLLLQAATAHNLHVDSAEASAELQRRQRINRSSVCDPKMMESISEDLLVERMFLYLTRHVPRPGRAEAEEFYKKNHHLYHLPEAVEAAHVFRSFAGSDELAAETDIHLAEGELLRGKSFQQVANRYSDCKGVGGAVGWVVRGQMVQEFEDVVFALQPGKRSEVFRTIFGFHIALVTRHRKAGVSPFDTVRQEIAHRLFEKARREALTQVLTRLRAQSEISYTEERAHA